MLETEENEGRRKERKIREGEGIKRWRGDI